MISIVMSYYNRRQLLFNTLHSIKESKCKSFEVVIVDDASDDKIDDIVRLFDFPINIGTILVLHTILDLSMHKETLY
jgi:glycosyltransferase involved in cell wall biosynthesis